MHGFFVYVDLLATRVSLSVSQPSSLRPGVVSCGHCFGVISSRQSGAPGRGALFARANFERFACVSGQLAIEKAPCRCGELRAAGPLWLPG